MRVGGEDPQSGVIAVAGGYGGDVPEMRARVQFGGGVRLEGAGWAGGGEH